MPKEIENINDIKTLVNNFYSKVRNDELLKDIFNNVIQDKWETHLEKMYKFWETILLDKHTYFGSPFMPHATLPIDKIHFERWLFLFHQTVNEHFEGIKAEKAKMQGERMAAMFETKIEYYRSNPNFRITINKK